MQENPVLSIIREEGTDERTVFVFPSEIASRLWLEQSLDTLQTDSLPADRFIAWDRFKETAVRSMVAGKLPVSRQLRKLYALNLAKRNTETKPFFTELIPTEYAAGGSIFASWIAGILPSLVLWEQKTRSAGNTGEDADLAFLKKDYTSFLDTYGLFEPAWQKPPLKDTGNRYIVFFPECIEDFNEYSKLVDSAPFIQTVPVKDAISRMPASDPQVQRYSTTREELRSTALDIEALLQRGVTPEEIAVSVPDLETVLPYLSREFNLRGIPFDLRAGNTLTALPAGRLFPLLQECAGSGFSFASVKALMLDRLVPWKDRRKAEALVEFGIDNHCITSWKENGRTLDVWDAAFRDSVQGSAPELASWYKKLSDHINAMAAAASFTELRTVYFSFRNLFLDMDLLAPEEDAVIARCISELDNLTSLEDRYAGIMPASPWNFFIAVLSETVYVPQRTHGGISIFPYRVAAGTPFPHHFVIDASQNRASVVYRELPFLRHDSRLRLNLSDTDVSEFFFDIYRLSGTVFSVSDHSFSGYSTPHGYLSVIEAQPAADKDPFRGETLFFSDPTLLPDSRYPVQQTGFARWRSRQNPGVYSLLKKPVADGLESLAGRIRERQMDGTDVRVTQSDLADFSICNARWFLKKILKLREQERDAALINERNLGLVIHEALAALYAKIRDHDGSFLSAHKKQYYTWADEAARNVTSQNAEFAGPLAAPIITLISGRVAENVRTVIDLDAQILDGYIPHILEAAVDFREDGLLYFGRIDRISLNPADSSLVLIDYKSGTTPRANDCKPVPEDAEPEAQTLQDFQMPLYILLAENMSRETIREGWFANLKEKKYSPVVTDRNIIDLHSRTQTLSREEMEPSLNVCRIEAGRFARALADYDFTRPEGLSRKVCAGCAFFRICRTTYTTGTS